MLDHSKPKSGYLVLLSGGLDSTAALASLVAEGHAIECLFVSYGHKAELSERSASRRIADYFGVRWTEIALPWLGALGKSALTEPLRNLPMLDVSDLTNTATVQASGRAVWVHNRNAVLAMVAAAVAESRGLRGIVLGLNAEEAETFADNSAEFGRRVAAVLALSTQTKVEVECPTVAWTKREIVQRMRALNLEKPFPWDLLGSCYAGGEIRCGQCESCARLERALS